MSSTREGKRVARAEPDERRYAELVERQRARLDERKLAELVRLFRRDGVILAYLFGSQATGRVTPMSDVDLAVLFGPDVPPEEHSHRQIDLITDIMPVFKRNDVDVVVLNRATPLLAYEVIGGNVIFCEDEEARVDFFKRTLWRYFDTVPLRRQLWEAFEERMDKKLEEGLETAGGARHRE